ncbi:LysR family transcriptional regulator [Roseomonas marmotae]|uniref:LysR family transcriptional regulator n=1 Tax=Roseomonas marmotae TaxID=2768161 RepID=A0ABS3KFX7_9PROT|nr:LysR family transcriptional regulator [Roseomonas marmotae]MBO1076379.1 LysR family transcriptional regulator [Roseomonas marmotae]QTI79411.1 LysR family transcriptional regulator [Roseomonas marmotae]
MSQTDRLPDLNLLRLFVALVEERHVTHAGKRLFLSQPAASGGLRRLREHFQDELLAREGQALRPTPRAEELYALIQPLLEQMADAIAAATPFDPATAQRNFVLGCSDAIAFALLPPLLTRFRQAAPGCALSIRQGNHHSLPSLLASGEIEAALGYMGDDLPANARMRVVGHTGWQVLRDAATAPVTEMEAYCARPHVLISSRGQLEGNVDALLRTEGRQRRVVLGVSSFSLLAAALPGTELIATVPDFVASRLAQRYGLITESPPVSPTPTPTSLVWNGSRDRDPGDRWFRGEVLATMAELLAHDRGKVTVS